MRTMKRIGRIPPTWFDTGSMGLTEAGYEKYIELICDRLPDEVDWAEDDSLIAPIDYEVDDSFDIDEIVYDAFHELMTKYDNPTIWVYDD